ncbi:MAG: hypothetical protein KME04_20120 [Pleurocapsa minor GSE-CHR-MK-17-07R]|jgi:hypothetical protein|nr:hypothetical protein [Pleurocapsa minor GSE-CHR-MK 17-07R]
MRLKMILLAALVAAGVAACDTPPPTVVFVVTSTPAPEITPEVTESATAQVVAQPTTPAPTLSAQTGPTATPAGPTPLPPGFPTPVAAQVQYAEQLFEGGRMFWLQPIGQIWVLTVTGEGRGTWATYEDTWTEGDPINDPSIVVPGDNRQQPVRGFGQLWRSNTEVRDVLSWATQPEFGYVGAYEYHSGGQINAAGTYERGPGYHIIYSLYGERFRLNEADGTWTLGG